jgi:uncharacterized repeat protein (TIGR03803 family)
VNNKPTGESRSSSRVARLLVHLLGCIWAAALFLTAYRAQPAAVLTTLYSFQIYTEPAQFPSSALVLGRDGNLYGTAHGNISHQKDYGTVFMITTNGVLTNLYYFTDGDDGALPSTSLLLSRDGSFYGTTSEGGTNAYYGTVFQVTTNGMLTSLYSFQGGTNVGPADGPLVQGSDGNLYGAAAGGVINQFGVGNGALFKMAPDGALTMLYFFTNGFDGRYPGGAYFDARYPCGGLVQGSDGNFYGTAYQGGTNGAGTVFKVTTNGTFTSLYSFAGANDGTFPSGTLALGPDGSFYGTASYGGTNGSGTIFKITADGALTPLYSFTGGDDGAQPTAPLLLGSDGNFYGTTASAGNGYGVGTIFKIDTNGTLTTVYTFTNGADGGEPSPLIQASDGSFYGVAGSGGLGGAGTVFRLAFLPAAPVFQTPALTNGTLTLTWCTEPGGTYQLQYMTNLGANNWTDLGSPAPAVGATLTTTDSVTNGPQRFYRVVRSP